MHMMIRNLVHFDRAEGSKPHMQRNPRDRHAFFFNLLQQLRRKVKPRRGSSRRSGIDCVDSLVSVFVLQLMRNIRGQRHLAKPIQYFFKYAVISKLDQAISFFHNANDFSRQKSFPKVNPCPNLCLLPWFYQSLPYVILSAFQQQYLYLCVGSFSGTDQPCRNYFRIIDDQTVSFPQIFGDLSENTVRNNSRLLIKDKQSGALTIL